MNIVLFIALTLVLYSTSIRSRNLEIARDGTNHNDGSDRHISRGAFPIDKYNLTTTN